MAYGTINADLMTTSDGVSSSGLYGFKNRIINGAMVIDQRNAGASVSASDGTFDVDRWQAYTSANGKFTMQQTPSATETGYATRVAAGFTNYVACTSSAATSLGATDSYAFAQKIEGYNFADLGFGTASAKTVTLSAWVYSSLTGTFGGALSNSGLTRSYPFSYSIPTANTWTQISITITGDTSGTWLTTNGTGCRVIFSLGAGSSVSGTAGSWSGNDYRSATGAVSVVGTNGATFYITGTQLEVGSTATSFDYRPISTEIQLCQRYFVRWKNSSSSEGLAWNPQISPVQSGTTGNLALTASLPVVMRTTATSVTTNLTNANYPTSWTLDSAFVTGNVTKTGTVGFNLTGSASTVTLALTGATWSPNPNLFYLQISSSYVDISAEL